MLQKNYVNYNIKLQKLFHKGLAVIVGGELAKIDRALEAISELAYWK
ncbi:MAG: hypothetical protein R3A13_10025 [Bdellovibrionota bacterium]